jgi:hypothetical protein
MIFQLYDPVLWKPLFGVEEGRMLSSMQIEYLNYAEIDTEACRELEREIHRILVSKIEKWRGRFVTKWNR